VRCADRPDEIGVFAADCLIGLNLRHPKPRFPGAFRKTVPQLVAWDGEDSCGGI
jgi:hypothetical protein